MALDIRCSCFVLLVHSRRWGKLFLPMLLNFSSEVLHILDYKAHFPMLPSLTVTQMHSRYMLWVVLG